MDPPTLSDLHLTPDGLLLPVAAPTDDNEHSDIPLSHECLDPPGSYALYTPQHYTREVQVEVGIAKRRYREGLARVLGEALMQFCREIDAQHPYLVSIIGQLKVIAE